MDIDAPFHNDQQLLEDLAIDAMQVAARLVDRLDEEDRAKLAQAVAGGARLSVEVHMGPVAKFSLRLTHPTGDFGVELLRVG